MIGESECLNSPGHNGKGVGASACAAAIEYGFHELNIAKVYAANFGRALGPSRLEPLTTSHHFGYGSVEGR